MAKQKKWRVYASVVGTKYLGEVEAATKEEAEEKAWDLDSASVGLCWSCSDQMDDPQIDSVTAEVAEDD